MKKIHNLPDKKTLRQKLRHIATPAEKLLWKSLKKSGVGAKFRVNTELGLMCWTSIVPNTNWPSRFKVVSMMMY